MIQGFFVEFAESMACRKIGKLRRGLLLWPLVGPTRATARRASVSSTEVSENRKLGSNAYSHCQPVAVENREAIRTTSMMDDCNARALTPLRKSSIAVLSSRLVRNSKSRQRLREPLLAGFELLHGRFTLSRLYAAQGSRPRREAARAFSPNQTRLVAQRKACSPQGCDMLKPECSKKTRAPSPSGSSW